MPAPRPKHLDIDGISPHGYQATGASCLATQALIQMAALGPGRQDDGRLLVEPPLLRDLFPLSVPQAHGWSFHQAPDRSRLLAHTGRDGLLHLAPLALVPTQTHVDNPRAFGQWVDIARALPPCGMSDGWVFPWFEGFVPTPQIARTWHRWCGGWLEHARTGMVGSAPLPPNVYIAVQAGHIDHTGRLTPPRVVAHADLDPRVANAMVAQLAPLWGGMAVEAMIAQTAPLSSSRVLLGTSQRCPAPTSAHQQAALVFEALHSPLAATMSA